MFRKKIPTFVKTGYLKIFKNYYLAAITGLLFSPVCSFGQSILVDFSDPKNYSNYIPGQYGQYIGTYIGPYSDSQGGPIRVTATAYYCYPIDTWPGGTRCSGTQGAFASDILLSSTSTATHASLQVVVADAYQDYGGDFNVSASCSGPECISPCVISGAAKISRGPNAFTVGASGGIVSVDCPAPIRSISYSNYNNYAFVKTLTLGTAKSNLNLSVAQDGTAFTASPSTSTSDGNFSVKPNVPTTIYVKVSGSGFNTSETRTANVSLKIGNNSPMTVLVSVAAIKAAGTLQVPFTYTFTADQVGKIDLSASINSSEDSDVSNNNALGKTYVLCNVEDSGTPLSYFQQGGTSRWAGDDYANQAPQKMRKLGCYTTSFAMLMQSYKITKSLDGVSSIDPGSVNQGLNAIGYYSSLGPAYSQYGGYTPSGAVHPIGAVNFARASYAKNCIAAGGMPSACKSKAAGKISYIKRTNTFSSNDQKELNKQLCAGNPVILKVPSISSPSNLSKAHFVLAKGMTVNKSGNFEYLAYDPAQIKNSDKTTNYAVSNIRGFRLYKQTADPSMISIHLAGGLNMVVTDPMGNKVGFDPYTRRSYNSIQGATYTAPESIDSPDSSASTPLEATFEYVAALDGRYQIQIFGNPNVNSSYRLTRYSFDDIGNINAISDKSGIISAAKSVVLLTDHTSVQLPAREASLIIGKALYFDLARKDKAFVSGRIVPEDGRAISKIYKFVTIRLGSIVKSIELKKMKRISFKKDTYYVHLEGGPKGLALVINADSGEFSLYVDHIELDGSQLNLTTNLDIQIDDIHAENLVTFKDVKRRKDDR